MSRVTVVGIGGGGDVAAASIIAKKLEEEGLRTFLGSVIWERAAYDPLPGPISPRELIGAKKIDDYLYLVYGHEYVVRKGRKVIPQAVRAAKAINKPVYVLDLKGGWYSMFKGFRKLVDVTAPDQLIIVDAGGDSLAYGWERNLWSPLADSLSLSASPTATLAIYGPGCDGELSTEEVLEKILELYAKGCNEGGFVIDRKLATYGLEIVKYVRTEASRISLEVALGRVGEVKLRSGSRRVRTSPILAVVFFINSTCVDSLTIKAVKGSRSVEEASNKLLNLCIFSELELEKMIYVIGGYELAKDMLVRIREEGRVRVCGPLARLFPNRERSPSR